MRLKDKVAIITGAANGMGEAEARLFSAEGATVVLTDVDEARGETVAADILGMGGETLFVAADVSKEEDWRRLLDATLSRYGRLDILINNAGISSSSIPVDDLSAWDRLMDVNAKSVFLGSQMAADIMKSQGKGSIVNISSIFGVVGGESGHVAYHASKAAVRNVTKALAVRLAAHGVRVNSVHPGYMTPMVSAISPSPERALKSPMMRLGEPVEVAYGVLFLASDEASYVTGAELAIDGGFLAR